MATLRRSHTPVPWGAQVDRIVWEKSRSGKPRRRRLDRPPLRHDPGWDWDGTQILFNKQSIVPNSGSAEKECCTCELADQPWGWDGRTCATLSLLDIAQYQVTKRRHRARSDLDDFEVVRIPNVVPVLEEGPDSGDSWKLSDWEKLDVLSTKRTYSEVAQGFIDGKDPPAVLGYSRLTLSSIEDGDDSWEHL